MTKTLAFMKTHLITPIIIEEYIKMEQSGKDCYLFIDNTTKILEDRSSETQKFQEETFFCHKVKCVLCDTKKFTALQLPLYSSHPKGIMWYNCDYPLYLMRHYFPDYDYYWQFEYDVFFNGKNYQTFFEKYDQNKADLLVTAFREAAPIWDWAKKVDWVYAGVKKYACLYPVERLSGRALDLLYQKRIEYGEKYKTLNKKKNNWLHCEVFTATEIMANHLSAENLPEQIKLETINLNKDRLFLHPDNILYHSVKENPFTLEIRKMHSNMLWYAFLAKVLPGKLKAYYLDKFLKLVSKKIRV